MHTIELTYSPHLMRAVELVNGAVENRARKRVVLSVREGRISLLHGVWKKKEKDDRETPVIIAEYEIGGHADRDGSVVLSSSVLSHIAGKLKTHNELVLTVGEEQISIKTGDELEYSETLSPVEYPGYAFSRDVSPVGTFSSSQLAQAMEAVGYAAGIIPEASNSTAFTKRGDALELLAGHTTRRALCRIKGFEACHDELQALCPSYFARGLVRFFKEIGEQVEIARGETSMLLNGAQFTIEIHAFTEFSLVAVEHPSPSGEGVLYRLNGENISMLSALTAVVAGYEKHGSVRLAKEGKAMVVRNFFSDGSEFHYKIPVEKVAGEEGHVIEIASEDLKRAFEGTRVRNVTKQPVYLHSNGEHSVSMRRAGDPDFSFDIAQLRRNAYALRPRISVYAAVSGDYGIIRDTVCQRILLSHYSLPDQFKNPPSRFRSFLLEHGLIDEKGRRLKDVMIDNGAFTARKDGKEVDEEAFFEFIAENEEFLTQYTMNDFYYSTFEDNLESYRRMTALGLSPVFIVHMGEPFSSIERLFNGEYGFTVDRIGWGGAAVDTPEKRMEYVGRAVSLIPDPSAVKIHGFGMVSQLELLQSFPFDSGDASTYAVWATHRKIPTPWGLLSLKPGAQDYVGDHPLRGEIEQWVESLSYEKPVSMHFTVEKLSEESSEGLMQRQLFGLAYYNYLERGYPLITHMERQLRFIEWDRLVELEPVVKSVAFPAVESMNPIEIAA